MTNLKDYLKPGATITARINRKTLINKQDVVNQLENAGIEICNSRGVGYNSFNLVYETYGHFVVNAKAGTSFETTRAFSKKFGNITILTNG